MNDLAINADNLGKRYQLGVIDRQTLQDELRYFWHRFRGRNPRDHMGRLAATVQPEQSSQSSAGELWALRDVCLSVDRGEIVGIIGRNGSGKSTLLKILCRITDPTSGTAIIDGRVGSLLEVGTGFHPELTGLENIFLNGAILGMTRAEISRKLDSILEFSEIERFVETPVKRYSSGMYVRLAFAVAAHLDPEILLIDEVLAVGDAGFQKKCLDKMSDIATGGRTILFVSHNMPAVQQLCSRCIVLDQGRVTFNGETSEAVKHYMDLVGERKQIPLGERRDRKGTGALRFEKVEMVSENGEPVAHVLSGQNVRIRFYYRAHQAFPLANVSMAFNVLNNQRVLLTNLCSQDVGVNKMPVFQQGFFECFWPDFNLRSGSYDCNLYCKINGEVADWIQSATTLQVEDGDFYGTGRLTVRSQGDILVKNTWRSEACH